MRDIKVWLVAGLIAAGVAAPATAQRRDRDWNDRGSSWDSMGRIEGQSVDRAKETLRHGGFAPVRSVKRDGQQWDLWASGGRCIGFTSYKGTVTNSRGFDDRDCAYGISDRRNDDRGWNDGRGGRFDLRDIVGLSVDEGKRSLSYSGYRGARSISLRGQQWDLWSGGGSCVGFTSYYGRVTDAQRFPDQQCR